MPTVTIPAKYRDLAYFLFGLLGLGLGGVQVGFLTAHAGQPVWLTVALAVYAFLGRGTGLLARANLSPDASTPEVDEESLPDAQAVLTADVPSEVEIDDTPLTDDSVSESL